MTFRSVAVVRSFGVVASLVGRRRNDLDPNLSEENERKLVKEIVGILSKKSVVGGGGDIDKFRQKRYIANLNLFST